MKGFAVISGKLGLICAISALCLGFVNMLTAPRIAYIKELRLQEALSQVSVGGETGEYKEIGEKGILGEYPLSFQDGHGEILRLVGKGYGGDLNILASFDQSGKILAVKMMENLETPGLGKEAEKPEYMKMFVGKGSSEPVPVRKNQLPQERADAISGATITFSGVANALLLGSDYVKATED